jgi:predicted dehydrogenase
MALRLVAAGFAHPHIKEFLSSGVVGNEAFQIVGVWDPRPQYAQQMADRYGAPQFEDYRQMLDALTPDVLATGAINRDRGTILAEALTRGVHCIADKPLCTTVADLDRIEQLSRDSAAMVSLLLPLRFTGCFVAVKDLIDEGRLGRVVSFLASNAHPLKYEGRPAWMFDPVQYGGLINDLTVHMIDLVRWFSGREIVEVYATKSCNRICPVADFADAAAVHCSLADGGDAAIVTNWLSGTYRTSYCHFTVFGTKGIASWDQRSPKVFSVAIGTEEPFEVTGDLPSSSVGMAADFLKLLAGEKCVMSPPEAFRSTRATLYAQQAAEAGHPLQPVYV